MIENIFNQCPLAGICCEYGNLRCWISKQSHVLIDRHCIFRFPEILDEVRTRFCLTPFFVVDYVDELVLITETSVSSAELLLVFHNRQIPKLLVSPSVQF